MVPDIPEEVEIKIKREHYMAKEALAENQVSFTQTIRHGKAFSIFKARFLTYFPLCHSSVFE